GPQHDVGNLVGAMRPDIDDFIVAVTRSDDAFAILFFDFVNLFLGGFDFLIFFLRNDHVIDADGNARTSRLAEAQFLELVESGDGFFVAANLVTLPNQVTEGGLAHDNIRKAQLLRPDFAED